METVVMGTLVVAEMVEVTDVTAKTEEEWDMKETEDIVW